MENVVKMQIALTLIARAYKCRQRRNRRVKNRSLKFNKPLDENLEDSLNELKS